MKRINLEDRSVNIDYKEAPSYYRLREDYRTPIVPQKGTKGQKEQ